MIEVFKTNVREQHQATKIVAQIQVAFSDCKANFDLEDCDNILRVKCSSGIIHTDLLIDLLNRFGFSAEILAEEIPLLNYYE